MRITTTRNVKHFYWDNNYWKATYSSGTTDQGSSGSALFNEYNEVIGQLSRGWSSCNFTDFGDRYGKFYQTWDGAGLGEWLSPSNNQYAHALILSPITLAGPTNISCNPQGYSYSVLDLLGVLVCLDSYFQSGNCEWSGYCNGCHQEKHDRPKYNWLCNCHHH